MKRPALSVRVLRSLTAILAVWCLGCNAFDPLIGALLDQPGGALMVCASESTAQAEVASAPASKTPSVTTPASDAGNPDGIACGCDSCHAPAATLLALHGPPAPQPQQPVFVLAAPPSVKLPPLVPPPQHSA